MQRVSTDERRRRVGIRHHIAPSARIDSVVEVARDLVCFHATDPAAVYLSAWARLNDPSLQALDTALYEDRSLVRMLAMRRTMWVTPREDAAILQSAASNAVAVGQRKLNEQLAERAGVANPTKWLRDVEAATLAELERRGEATAQELSRAVPGLELKARVAVGKKYEADIGLSSRVLLLLALEGKIVRGRPRGTWISSQYRWAPLKQWLGAPLAEVPTAVAQAELVKRWLARFGPGTEMDIRWWTGWTAGAVRAALKSIGAAEVALDDGSTGYVLPGDWEPTPEGEPWVALLPSLDPTTMGWQARGWYLDAAHKPRLFDTNGNAGPTIWVDGRIAGGWAVRPNGEVVTLLLEDVGQAAARAVDDDAGRLTACLQSVRVVPRFPVPIQKELVG